MSLDSGQLNKAIKLEIELPSDCLQGPGHPCRLKGRVEGPVKQKEDKTPSKCSTTSSEASQTDRQTGQVWVHLMLLPCGLGAQLRKEPNSGAPRAPEWLQLRTGKRPLLVAFRSWLPVSSLPG